MSADLLGEQNVADILLGLLEYGELSIGELIRKVGVSRWRFSILKPQLINQNLIEENRTDMKKMIKLTKKGKEVALALKKAREALEK